MKRLALLVIVVCISLPVAAQSGTTADQSALLTEMEEVLRNESLALFIHQETAEIAVRDLETDVVWFSNPPERSDDPVANPLNISRLSSQVIAFLYSPSDQEVVLDSASNAVAKGQYEIERERNVVRVTYRLNNFERGEQDIPMVVGQERFETIFLDQVPEEDREILLERFTLRPDEGVYRRFTLPAFLVSEFVEIMDEVGYTAEDLEFDNEANAEILARLDPDSYDNSLQLRTLGPADSGRASVTVVVEYSLAGRELVVRIPSDQIVEDPVYPLNAVRVLPFFAAAGSDEEGYLVLPDGAGTLINFNNGKTRYRPFQMPIYGPDFVNERDELRITTEQAFLPMYAIVRPDRAVAVDIVGGAPIGELNADISGRLHSYNWAAADFNTRARGRITIGSGFQETSKLVFQSERYTGTIELHIGFLYGNQATYVGVADWYRARLASRMDSSERPDLSAQRPAIELIGGVEKQRSILGVVIRHTEPATTVAQAERILEQLASFGMSTPVVRYRGWFNDDIEHDFPSRVQIPGSIGGRRAFGEFVSAAGESGVTVFPDVYFSRVFERGDGFSPRRHAVRFLDQTVARQYRYNQATYQIDQDYVPNYLLSPSRLETTVSRFTDRYESVGAQGVSLADLGRVLTSDFDEDALVDRGEAETAVVNALTELSRRVPEIMLDGANAYALPFADYITNVPTASSRFRISDEDVPLLPLVLRGLVRFSYEPLNRADDMQRHFLQSLETGAELGLLWTWTDASVFKDTRYDHFYSTGYSNWMEDTVAYYRELADFRRAVGNRPVIGRERIGEQLYRVRFGDDLVMVVNYSSEAAVVGGESFDGLSYRLRELEEAPDAR